MELLIKFTQIAAMSLSQKNRLVKLFLSSLAVVFCSFFFTSSAKAISISPLTFELNGNPGDKLTNVIRVYNDQDVPVAISIDIENFSAAGEEGRVVIEPGEDNTTYSLASWVTVSPAQFVLDPRSFRTIEYTVTIPPGAEPGGHYGSILASIGASSGGGVGVAQKVASLLLLNVSGELREDLQLVEFSAPGFSEYGPVIIASRFQNRGSIHVKPRGFILIRNMLGKEVANIELAQSNTLPGTIRKIETAVGKQYMFGKYTATLTAIYGSTNEPLSGSVSFWVIPWKITIGVLLALFLILFVLIRGRRRFATAFRILIKGDRR